MNASLVVYDARTMLLQIDETLAEEHGLAIGAALCAILALGLACLGVFGVAAHSVVRRTREIGIRMALGAQPGEIRGMVLREGLWLSLVSVAVGGAVAWPVVRLVRGMLFGVGPADPWTFTAVALLLTSVTLAASWIPARRAARIEPSIALRHE